MELLVFILWTAIVGFVVGALGRLAVPGPNPMGAGMTILCGLGGAFLGMLVGSLLRASSPIVFLLEIAGAALIVYAVTRRRTYGVY